MPWSSHSCNDHKYSYFTRNICNRCIDSSKVLFGATSEACSAIVTTIWRPGFKTAVCESWNVSDKYTWDNAGDLKQLSMDQTLNEDNKSGQETVFRMVTLVFDNSNLSQENFAIDTWGGGSCNMLFGTWSQAHAYDPSDYMETRL